MLPNDILDTGHLGENYKVLNRVPFSSLIANPFNGPRDLGFKLSDQKTTSTAVIVDTETTGLDHRSAEVIEIGMLLVGLDTNNELCEIIAGLNAMQQPSAPLPDIIKEITGLTDEELRGHIFDKEEVQRFMLRGDMVIAHNAGFDRPFYEKTFGDTGKVWACSSRGDIDWKHLGYKSSALERILAEQGFFYEAHRASVDCAATAWALFHEPKALAQLISNSKQPQFLIRAIGAPFNVKDSLKAIGYFWNAPSKVWEKEVIGKITVAKAMTALDEIYDSRLAKLVERKPENKYRA